MANDGSDKLHLCGYKYLPKEIERIQGMQPNPVLSCKALGIQDSGKGKDVFLFEVERQLTGAVRAPHNQTIGDCVSHGTTGAAEDLQFVQMSKDRTIRFAWLASEVTYGLARIQIGRGGCGFGDGANVGWGLQSGKDFGFLERGVYSNYDLTKYNGQTAKQFGAPGHGCPAELATLAKHNPISEMSNIEGPDFYSQCIDVIANGGVIVTGSNQLYRGTRDKNGFCQRGGSGGHCTHYNGFTDNSKNPGIVYVQSWGEETPTNGAQLITLGSGAEITLPPAHFLITPDDFNRMHRSGGEVWGIHSETSWMKPDTEIDFIFY